MTNYHSFLHSHLADIFFAVHVVAKELDKCCEPNCKFRSLPNLSRLKKADRIGLVFNRSRCVVVGSKKYSSVFCTA